MQRFIFILIIVVLLHLSAAGTPGTVVKNPDQPQKGKWDFKPEKVWDIDAIGDDVLADLRRMKADREGNLYIYEYKQKRFYVLDPDGKLLYSFGERGEGPGEFKMTPGLFILNDRLIIPDSGKIHVFSKKGEPIRAIKGNSGGLLFIDENRLIKRTYHPILYDKRDDPNYLELYNLETKETRKLARVELKDRFIEYKPKTIRATLVLYATEVTPTLIVASDSRSLYYGYTDRYQINKIDFNGKPLLSFSIEGRKKNRISLDARIKYSRILLEKFYNMPRDGHKKLANKIPDESSYFNKIRIDPKGLIYVFLVDLENLNKKSLDIFSREGKYIYHSVIDLSNDFERIVKMTFSWARSELYVFAHDEDGEVHLVKYKVNLPL